MREGKGLSLFWMKLTPESFKGHHISISQEKQEFKELSKLWGDVGRDVKERPSSAEVLREERGDDGQGLRAAHGWPDDGMREAELDEDFWAMAS